MILYTTTELKINPIKRHENIHNKEITVRLTWFILPIFLVLNACSDNQTKKNETEFEGTYDVVINNGRVIDPETSFDRITNIGIKDGKIITISTSALVGNKTIDASGHIVSAGFIDTHNHGAATPHGGKLS